jgi:two-component system sensor histidine kinase and response regulator WspE
MNMPEIDSSLLELFREEVRGQVNVLNQGLVELERSSSPRQVEPLMRAAHSIKGAARLIGVDPAVKLAHVMEDCLVAVQQGSLQLKPSGIDVLLAGTDWLGQFGEAAGSGFEDWFKPHQASIAEMIRALECVLRGEDTGSTAPVATSTAKAKPTAEPSVTAAPKVAVEPISWKTSVSAAMDPAALEMFRADVGQGLSALTTALDAWRIRPLSADEVAEAVATIKGMRGVAMLLRVEPFAKLLSTLETKVQAAGAGTAALSAAAAETLERTRWQR